ncbi:MAG: penicillin-binding protein 1C [Chloroflexi bacterium]|nr:penicillin-binding protein 1C [Chloroflexota bacterium]
MRKKIPYHVKWLVGILIFLALLWFGIYLIPVPPEAYPNSENLRTIRIEDRNGGLLREVASDPRGYGNWVPLAKISPHLINATLCQEDRRFYRHPGVDFISVGRAAFQNLKAGRIISGASTITMQVARHVYHIGSRSVPGKLYEMLCALRLERKFTKEQILELYLNRVSYGNMCLGAETASELYFNTACSSLSLAQAAFLATLPRAPSIMDPYRNPGRAEAGAKSLLSDMERLGYEDKGSVRIALDEKIKVVPPEANFRAPHFCDFILDYLKENKITGVSRLRTTLSLPLQKESEALLEDQLLQVKDKGVTNSAVLVMDNATGEILAMVGSADYFSKERDGQVNACLSLRQPGSAMKPFTYALALESGYTPADLLPDIPLPGTGDRQGYSPKNYDETYHGPVRFREALACSFNVASVNLLDTLGTQRLLALLQKAGFSHLERSASFYGLGLTLGSGEVTLLELVRAYSAFSRGGELIPERFILAAYDAGGKKLSLSSTGKNTTLFSSETAYTITDILGDHQARAPAFGQWCVLNLPFPCAAKTGTSKAFRDNWTVGYTTEYTVGVWAGNFDGKEMKRVSGITGAGPLFADVMLYLHKNSLPPDFPVPAGIGRVPVCPDSGCIPGRHCNNYIMEIFPKGREKNETCSVHRAVMIDSLTGMPAAADTPPYRVREKIYRVFDPMYDEWMSKNGEKPPPAAYAVVRPGLAAVNKPEICSPSDGSIFVRDPVLRKEYQSIPLSAVVPRSSRGLTWFINGKKVSQEGDRSPRWALKLGRHTFRAEVTLPGKGKVKSSPVEVTVL